ncbi:hypothetical protein C0991_003750 [Blastosporella zonata]|nr:hypothetical protein C0991_003750 [Blastosporella zonata]
MNQYLDRVFKMAQPNLRINGHNYETLDQNEYNTEPFDEALDRMIWSLADTRLQWQKRIAETRRTIPQEFEATVLDLFDQQRAVDAEATVAFHGKFMDDMEPENIDEIMPRHSHIEEGFHKTVALGEELDQTTVSQEERAQRALVATGEVKALKP